MRILFNRSTGSARLNRVTAFAIAWKRTHSSSSGLRGLCTEWEHVQGTRADHLLGVLSLHGIYEFTEGREISYGMTTRHPISSKIRVLNQQRLRWFTQSTCVCGTPAGTMGKSQKKPQSKRSTSGKSPAKRKRKQHGKEAGGGPAPSRPKSALIYDQQTDLEERMAAFQSQTLRDDTQDFMSVGNYKNLDCQQALSKVHGNTVGAAQINTVLDIVGADNNSKFDLHLFSALCALSERMLYHVFVTEEDDHTGRGKRDALEEADFYLLDMKLQGCNISQEMKKLFSVL
ncbi:uncharacterized protein LOC133348555 isoform X5 [Lethenteron reissneri]|uniref:uncharacterized protein LOC133348555 isoform X5 n=1 Tax=Lethenteron reissneri TaxID=7753 RepID=UPI002AB6DDE7|nr:uncharacterized protein LOC133348555 isoform X5 [Lethenteron reissneri]